MSPIPWHAHPGDWQTAAATCEALGANVLLGVWPTEQTQRQSALDRPPRLKTTTPIKPEGIAKG